LGKQQQQQQQQQHGPAFENDDDVAQSKVAHFDEPRPVQMWNVHGLQHNEVLTSI